jgi:hypothetical protein
MATFWAIAVVVGVVGLIWFNVKLDDPAARKRARLERVQRAEQQRARIVCPHCATAGQVTVRLAVRKKGVSGGKATGALLTGGASMLLTGLSRKEPARELHCGNCGMTWDVA